MPEKWQCELCRGPACMFCPADGAALCKACDTSVHGANFLVARHVRFPLCRRCGGAQMGSPSPSPSPSSSLSKNGFQIGTKLHFLCNPHRCSLQEETQNTDDDPPLSPSSAVSLSSSSSACSCTGQTALQRRKPPLSASHCRNWKRSHETSSPESSSESSTLDDLLESEGNSGT